MTHATDLTTLVRWMSADFSNQEQAFANPPFYAHIRVCMRPLPISIFPEFSLFLEQAYDYMLNRPYRLRVLKFKIVDEQIELENYKLKEEQEAFFGASRDIERLKQLTPDHLEKMPGCDMIVSWTGKSFKGIVKPGKNCIVVRNGKETYLDNSFEIDEHQLISFDRGLDRETDELVWGSIAGPFHFVRWANFANEVGF
ncbi:chromophore lyase CpcT/CpeT [Aphanothece sacrum]|uniref:chromophore lyase CpcT/CpeT n=1 Tax=Aphanothece sacrum TaxID=1122 RepID=UPI000F60CD82|nr:chromophore lyase CpcT/CpeT [Aphanothece sacrum]